MVDSDCLFCKVVAGDVPADVVHRGERVLAFRDISPQAPTHILVLPREHVPSAADLTFDDAELVGRIFALAAEENWSDPLARKEAGDPAGLVAAEHAPAARVRVDAVDPGSARQAREDVRPIPLHSTDE
mgnify:CR=1 FL=1